MITQQGINSHITSDIGLYINCIQDRLNSSISPEWNWTDIGRFICLLVILTFLFMAPLFAQPINQYCPVTTSVKVDIGIYVDYDGQRIYFCCNRCRQDFLADPTMHLANLDYGASADSASDHRHDHPLHTKPASTDRKSNTGKVANQSKPSRHDNDITHDHSTDHGETGSAFIFIGKLHPVVVHFPIALVLAGFFITGIAIWIAAYFRYLWQCNNSPRLLWTYRLVLAVNALLIGITGHLGAILVYGPDHFAY